MTWKIFPSPAVTSTTNAATLCNVWVPRRSALCTSLSVSLSPYVCLSVCVCVVLCGVFRGHWAMAPPPLEPTLIFYQFFDSSLV